ncbi:leucine-rich repeat domain-containing protein [Mycetocola spongiae]|uniref:leucine-rich repeat domain-containing protein n=1 Tax=Mycetocola spongiae TaxID=2859226 RepID=UPI0021F42C1E|nr:leucine-rich repeat domain-containing protein [Mycetocola spongiae]UCR89886.1 leucine-rich repeat domain-containing protein [Mycetocola spongiae]
MKLRLPLSALAVGTLASGLALAAVPATAAPAPAPAQATAFGTVFRAADAPLIPDPALQAAIRFALDLSDSEPITQEHLDRLDFLMSTEEPITDLTGITGAANLTYISIENAQITDLSPLLGLDKLEDITLAHSVKADLSPLSELPKLRFLNLRDNDLSDIGALANMPAMEVLNISGNKIEDISVLASIPTLASLEAMENRISDVSALNGHPTLNNLVLALNKIADFSALGSMDGKEFVLGGQEVSGPPAYVPRDAQTYLTQTLPDTLRPREAFTWEMDVHVVGYDWDSATLHEAPTRSWAVSESDTVLRGGFVTDRDGLINTEPIPGSLAEITDPSMLSDLIETKGTVTRPIIWSEVTSKNPAEAPVDVAYNHDFTVTEGFPATNWQLDSAIPGLTLGADGVFSGTPTEAGSFERTISIRDSYGNTINHRFTLVVTAGATTPPSPTPPGGGTGTATPPPGGGNGGTLPDTGSDLPLAVGAAALALLLAGLATLRRPLRGRR